MESEHGPPRTVTRAYSLIQRMQDKASELDLQTEMATTGSLTHARALMVDEAQEPSNTTRRAQSTLPKSVVETGEEAGNLHLSMSINPLSTLRMSTPRLAKHQTLGTTIMSRSGRSDKARRAQEQHEQDMLEELDRMHEECQTLREDSKRHQESYIRRELQREATLAHLQQQLGMLKGETTGGNAAAAAEEQAKQLNAIRELHKEVIAGIDEAVDRHAQETDKVDLATLKALKRRCNALEEQIHADKQKQLSEDEAYQQKTQALREELAAMRAAAANFDQLHLAAAEEATKLKQAQALEQGQANMLVKQIAALKRDKRLLKEDLAAAEMELASWYETMQRETEALKLAYQPANEPPVTSSENPNTSKHRTSTSTAYNSMPVNAEVAQLKEQLDREQRRAVTAELAFAEGHHLHRLLQAAVRTVLQARSCTQGSSQSEKKPSGSREQALFASLADVPPPASLQPGAVPNTTHAEMSHIKRRPQTARPNAMHGHAVPGKGSTVRPQPALQQLPDPVTLQPPVHEGGPSLHRPASAWPQGQPASQTFHQRSVSGQQRPVPAVQRPHSAVQQPGSALYKVPPSHYKHRSSVLQLSPAQQKTDPLHKSCTASQMPPSALQASQAALQRPTSAAQQIPTSEMQASTPAMQRPMSELQGRPTQLQRPMSAAMQRPTSAQQRQHSGLRRPQSAVGHSWQQPHSVKGSKEVPFWSGYMEQPQTLHAYWISEKLEHVPARQTKQKRPAVAAPWVELKQSAGVDQQQEGVAATQAPLERNAPPADRGSLPLHATDLTEHQQQQQLPDQQDRHQQLISPTPSDASETEVDVSSLQQQSEADLSIAVENTAAQLPQETALAAQSMGRTLDAEQSNSAAAAVCSSNCAELPNSAGIATVGRSNIGQSEAGSKPSVQQPKADTDLHTRLAMHATQSSRGQRKSAELDKPTTDSLTPEERLQVIQQLLMQDAVVQLIEEQISLQEPPKLRGNTVPAALLRPVTTSHTQPPQQHTLEAQQHQVEGKENAGQRPWLFAAAQSEAAFLAGANIADQ